MTDAPRSESNPLLTIQIHANALIDASWMARVERTRRATGAPGLHQSVPLSSLDEIIEACSATLRIKS
jgi:hypothetical protein